MNIFMHRNMYPALVSRVEGTAESAFQAACPSSRGEAYLQQRGIPLALALQYGVGYAAPGPGRMPRGIGAGAAWSFRIRRRMEAWSTSTGVR